jgi:hypothetical protein
MYVTHAHTDLDLLLRVRLEDLLELVLVRTLAPPAVNDLDIEAEAGHHVDPQVREEAVAEADDLAGGGGRNRRIER